MADIDPYKKQIGSIGTPGEEAGENRRVVGVVGAVLLVFGILLFAGGLAFAKYGVLRAERLSFWSGLVSISLGITFILAWTGPLKAALAGKFSVSLIKGSPFELLGSAAFFPMLFLLLAIPSYLIGLDVDAGQRQEDLDTIAVQVEEIESLKETNSSLIGEVEILKWLWSGGLPNRQRSNTRSMDFPMLDLRLACDSGGNNSRHISGKWSVRDENSNDVFPAISSRDSPLNISTNARYFAVEASAGVILKIKLQIVDGIIVGTVEEVDSTLYNTYCQAERAAADALNDPAHNSETGPSGQ